ncbi:MAG: hypothetical protein ABMA15_04120 [Vicinamibacterales bacterium]
MATSVTVPRTATPVHRDGPSAQAHTLGAFRNVLVLCAMATISIAAYIFVGLDGWAYYTAPAAVRGYAAGHQLLRPAGSVGHLFGVFGFLMMLVPVVYAVRKKVKRFRSVGNMKTWLDVHVFCGVIGPVFVTFHTSFKFGGLISVAYWSMVAVVLSGFIGRYLFNRIPRSLRGLELGKADLDRRTAELGAALSSSDVPEPLLQAIESFEQRVVPAQDPSYFALFADEAYLRREVSRFRVEAAAVENAPDVQEVIAIATERATLRRRMAFLRRTKRLFDLWHVFHMPLVYIMFTIVVAHVVITLYMGYVPFMD